MKVYPLVIFYLFCLNCSSSDNSSYDNSPPNDPDPIGVVQEEVFYISQNIDGSNVSREVLLHLPLRPLGSEHLSKMEDDEKDFFYFRD